MRFLIKKFLRNKEGAIAVETVMAAPILLFALFKAVDIGLDVYTLQKMSKATKSGMQYVVNGGREEANVRGIMQSSFGQTIAQDEIDVNAYCGCLTETTNEDGTSISDDNSVGGIYTKFETTLSDNMCTATCSSGSPISVLIEIEFEQQIDGVLGVSDVVTRLQTRVQ